MFGDLGQDKSIISTVELIWTTANYDFFRVVSVVWPWAPICHKSLTRSHLREKCLFASQFQVTVHGWGDVIVAGTWNDDIIHSQEQIETHGSLALYVHAQLMSLTLLQFRASPGNRATHIQKTCDVFSHQLTVKTIPHRHAHRPTWATVL